MQHLLYLVHRIPYPPNKGDKVRSHHFLKCLSARYRVHLGTFVDDEGDWQHTDTVKAWCGETHFARLNPAAARMRSLSGLLSGEALTLPYYRDAGLQAWVNEVLAVLPIRRVLVFSSAMAQYVAHAGGVRRVADFVDMDSDKWKQYAATRAWPLSAIYRREGARLLEYERAVARDFDATVFVSQAEADFFKRLAPEVAAKTHCVNNGVDSDYFSPERDYPDPYAADEQALVFTGAMDYWPNVDAVNWFAREIFPGVREKFPAARFYVVGARPAPAVLKLNELPGVKVTGAVADVRPYLAHARFAVAPLRLARGVQNKVLEAMAMAKAVIASPEAAEGIAARRGKELLVAATPEEFVALSGKLLSGGAAGMGQAARARVLNDYCWEAGFGRLERLLEGPGALSGAAHGAIQPGGAAA